MTHAVPPEERDAVLAEWRRQSAEPLPAGAGLAGCTVAGLGVGALALLPVLLRLFGLTIPPAAGVLLRMALGGLIVGGLGAGAFGGIRRRRAARARLDSALEWLSSHPDDGDPALRRSHAVALILRAHDADSRGSGRLLDVTDARRRLGAAAGYVERIEPVLRDEVGARPVFTAAGDR